jgi:class 3 adenylate cyclase/TolB-like protein/tetratricopeptide (TPR) repeat protein
MPTLAGRTSRKLAAIMFTDVVGYSALAERNERLALDLVEEMRALARPLFAGHHGREIRSMGDGLLVEFGSSVEAVECAIALQTALHERNRPVPEERRILLRIGLHVGDVLAREGDVYGAAVNVAARIEPLAPPGGICVSRAVREQVREAVSHPLVPMGTHALKNIEAPMELFAVALPWLDRPTGTLPTPPGAPRPARRWAGTAALLALAVAAGALWWARRPAAPPPAPSGPAEAAWVDSIAVLPFENMTPDPANEFFSDSISEELIDALARLEGLKVCARTSAFAFKGKGTDVRTIGRRLGVNLVLEGSVRQAGDRFKVTAQLIRAGDGFHLWSDSFVAEAADPFAVQESIARHVVGNLQGSLGSGGPAATRRSTADLTAYQLFLQGRQHWNRRTAEDLRLAVELYGRALERDPRFALGELGLAEAYAVMPSIGVLSRAESFASAKEHALKALALDPQLAEAHATLGLVYSDWEWRWDEATRAFERAVAIKPGYATAHQWFAVHLRRVGRLDDALREARLARDLDPLSLVIRSCLGDTHYDRRDWAAAEAEYREMLRMDPEFIGAHLSLAATLMNQARWEEALAELRLEKDYSPYWVAMKRMVEARLLARRGDRSAAESAAADLERAVEREGANYWTFLVLVRCALGEADAALDWLDRALENRDYYFFMSMMDSEMDLIRTAPRYRELLEKHRLAAGLLPSPRKP